MAKAAAKNTKKKTFKKKEKRIVHVGIVHIQATFNNTIVTIADPEGNTVSWSSAGSLGFRGSRKGTPYAAQQAAMTAANKAKAAHRARPKQERMRQFSPTIRRRRRWSARRLTRYR